MTQVIDARVGFDLAHLYRLCEEAEGQDKAIITVPDKITALIDEVEALRSELDSAVEVAFNRGATEWVKLNYPEQYAKLSKSAA